MGTAFVMAVETIMVTRLWGNNEAQIKEINEWSPIEIDYLPGCF